MATTPRITTPNGRNDESQSHWNIIFGDVNPIVQLFETESNIEDLEIAIATLNRKLDGAEPVGDSFITVAEREKALLCAIKAAQKSRFGADIAALKIATH